MGMKQPMLALVTTSILLAFAGTPVFAQVAATTTTATTTATTTTATSKPATDLAATYSTFAGSDANATALVDGLRTGKSITLTSTSGATGTTSGSTTFTPATSQLGYGNVNIALALAKAELTKLGITDPTPAQLAAALNGGTVTTSTGATTLPGVLQMRSEGQGWGVIAKTLGFKLGAVVSASKTDKSAAAAERRADAGKGQPEVRAEKVNSNAGRPEKVERLAKVERPEKIERPERVARPERVERPERIESPKR